MKAGNLWFPPIDFLATDKAKSTKNRRSMAAAKLTQRDATDPCRHTQSVSCVGTITFLASIPSPRLHLGLSHRFFYFMAATRAYLHGKVIFSTKISISR